MSARISLRGMLRLILVYNLRRDNNVGFLFERLSKSVDSNQYFVFIDWDTVQGQPVIDNDHCDAYSKKLSLARYSLLECLAYDL